MHKIISTASSHLRYKIYHRRGNIRWAKYLQFQCHWSFCGSIIVLPWPYVVHKYSLFSIIKQRHLYLQKNFRGSHEYREKHKRLAQRIFPRLQYYHISSINIPGILLFSHLKSKCFVPTLQYYSRVCYDFCTYKHLYIINFYFLII